MAADLNYTIRETQIMAEGSSAILDFDWNREKVPAILLMPHKTNRPIPSALLLHGFQLSKERMASTIGLELLAQGIGSLSIDLPLHGERCKNSWVQPASLFEAMNLWRSAQQECRLALKFLAGHPLLDSKKLGLIGFSLGAFLGLSIAAEETIVRAIVLAGGGDLPGYVPFSSMIRKLANPMRWARRLKGRPLLMLNGRQDTIILPELAERLFGAAGDPKEIYWHESGHNLPQEAIAQAAHWLALKLS
jgi:uncharacterized protein